MATRDGGSRSVVTADMMGLVKFGTVINVSSVWAVWLSVHSRMDRRLKRRRVSGGQVSCEKVLEGRDQRDVPFRIWR